MDWTAHAFAMIHRVLPGQWTRLRGHLEDAPVDVQLEFFRVMQAFEQQVDRERQRARRGLVGRR